LSDDNKKKNNFKKYHKEKIINKSINNQSNIKGKSSEIKSDIKLKKRF